jgi:Flp pilus assembly protein TadD
LRRFWALLAVVFTLKLVVLLQLRDHPLIQPDAGLDTSAYVELARRVVNGDLALGPGLYYVSPLYIYVLAAVLAATDSFTAVRFLQILLGSLSVGFIFLTARVWFSERAAWLAAGLAALTGLLTFYEVLILQAGLDTFLTAAALLPDAWPRRDGRPSVRFCSRCAARPRDAESTECRPRRRGSRRGARADPSIPPGRVARRWRRRRHGPRHAAQHRGHRRMVTRVLAWRPQLLHREQREGDRLVPARSRCRAKHRGAAARRAARGGTGARPPRDGGRNVGLLLRPRLELDPAASRRCRGSWRKLLYTFHAQHIALPYSYPFYTREARSALRFYVIGPWLLAPLGLAGLIFAAPRDRLPAYLVWAAFVPAYAVGVAAFFVAERYRLPLFVPLAIGAGAALDLFWTRLAGRRYAALAAPAAFALALSVPLNWSQGFQDGSWDEGLRMAERLVLLGRYDEADAWVEKLRPGAVDKGVPDYLVGRQLLVKKETARAIAHLERARELEPQQPAISYALGQALLQAGRPADAVPHLRRGVDGGAQVPLLGYDLAVALEATGDFASAAAVIARITPGRDDDAEVWLRVGRLASGVKAPEVATRFFEGAVALRPGQASARQQLGLNLLLLGRVEDAARELTEAVRLDPRNADSLAHLAYCEVKLGRLENARTHVELAIAAAPDHPLALQLRSILRTRGSSP